MVRIATSIAAVTILAGTALAQGYYDDQQFERSLTDSENLEARSEAVLGDYLAAREDLEEQYGREITDNERREIFEDLEARDPQLFSLFKTGIKMGIKQGVKKGTKGKQNENLHVPINIDNLPGLPPSQRSLEEDEELFGRDYEEAELEAREPFGFGAAKAIAHRVFRSGGHHRHGAARHFGHGVNAAAEQQQDPNNQRRSDDLEERDFEELDEREPFGFGAAKAIAHRVFRSGGHHHHGAARHFGHGVNAAAEQQQDPNNQRRSDADDLFERDFEEADFEARDFEDLDEREPFGFGAAKAIAHRVFRSGGHGGHHHMHGAARHFGHGVNAAAEQQQDPNNQRRSDDLEERDFEELETREPFGFGAAKAIAHRVFRSGGHHHHGAARHFGHGVNAAAEQQQDPNNQRRSDAEDLFEREEFDSELEAREFEDLLEERGLRSWLKSKLGGNKSQPAPASDDQQYQREFDDMEDLEMREFDEDLEDLLARDYDSFDELD